MVEEVRDVPSMPRVEPKKSDNFSREIYSLTGGYPSMIPSASRKVIQALKEKRYSKKEAEKWVWAPFTNSARSDNMHLFHWRKESEKEDDYVFSKFNKQIQLVEFTEEEYDRLIPESNWSKEETLYLWDMCKLYDLRFVIIQDRYDITRFEERTVEDLKERYYTVAKIMLEARGEKEHPICKLPYAANYEKRRKALLEKYMLRTKEQDEEEKMLCEEARKLDIRIRKEEKEQKIFEKLMSSNDEELEIPEWTQGRKDPPKGPCLRSYYLTQPVLPSRLQKKVDTINSDLGIPLRPMPTQEVVELFEKLKKQVLILLNLQKYVVKKENEKKSIEDKIREYRLAATKKTQGGFMQIGMRTPSVPPVPMELKGQIAPPVRSGSSTRQTIGAMNNLQQPSTQRKTSNKFLANSGLTMLETRETGDQSPVKRPKKS